jgi:hypothetical protein
MAAISGQKTVTSAGAAEALGSQIINGPLMVKALLANTNNAYVGNDGTGDVTGANGMQLEAGDALVFEFVGDLAHIYLDVDTDGEGVAWLALNV